MICYKFLFLLKGVIILIPIKKAYGYVTRLREGKMQVLVFQHSISEAGIQIPKGTVNNEEETHHAVIREIQEETGLEHFEVKQLIAEDYWRNNDGAIHHRFFYKINISDAPDEWHYQPTGGGEEEGLTFHFIKR
ncbi:NUDIX domain-containing protein [Gracilibacillus lacisalsi]|uniref:NUDIX domain-containing protein n=1 Tax=Gracilibacillus lacisalsi TaxID=393087 RepID=UPI0003717C74|nr:NUDIX domain-containing protein [Gracilibacillus lacisalsi]